jgi:hypothetical protein
MQRDLRNRTEELARGALGDAAYEAAWEAGLQLNADEGVTVALAAEVHQEPPNC